MSKERGKRLEDLYKLPTEVMDLIEEDDRRRIPIIKNLVDQERARRDLLTNLARELGITVEVIDMPVCSCDGTGHTTRSVEFGYETLREELSTWLLDKPTALRLYSSHRSGDPDNPQGDRVRFSICQRFTDGKADPLTLLARQTLGATEGVTGALG